MTQLDFCCIWERTALAPCRFFHTVHHQQKYPATLSTTMLSSQKTVSWRSSPPCTSAAGCPMERKTLLLSQAFKAKLPSHFYRDAGSQNRDTDQARRPPTS